MAQKAEPFWKRKSLEEMSREEWESLCDGCARCCLQKLQDEEDDQVYYTRVACRYMSESCRCTVYQSRNEKVPTCVWLKPEDVEHFFWLPNTCAYRLLSEGKDLDWWHPLVSGDPETVHAAGISVQGKTLSDADVPEEEWEEQIINWCSD
ncbi:YcgN family cysteine cluster protein [Aestuariirhabdus sp. Z084]|uniref:YcgN family cysteine cluster protein n=1 Tax=Aestuariirhabdus haliotis TaxID=2918751 RepID=UPI00201B3E9D|nr:YcgN family cysteine cluster protein [Aestuariirhabdus haliotis]MCL6416900.1 YcgN family cysteine cluster protein [Aestuariirhabdus haliotis]MCL6420881.1 YcgN family cysteine cluster protein [Aestuariirhabdus haliotis]